MLIYKGQSAVLGKTAEGPCLAEMAEHEQAHLEKFQELVRNPLQFGCSLIRSGWCCASSGQRLGSSAHLLLHPGATDPPVPRSAVAAPARVGRRRLRPRCAAQTPSHPLLPRRLPLSCSLSRLLRRSSPTPGAGSALLGKEAAYAVTEAVEEVISEHYNAQIRELLDSGLEDEEELREARRLARAGDGRVARTAFLHSLLSECL